MTLKELRKYQELINKFYGDEEFLELLSLAQIKSLQAKSQNDETGKPYIKDMLLFLLADLEQKELEVHASKQR